MRRPPPTRHPDTDPDYAGHAFADVTGRFPDDAALRAHGFRIAIRKRRAEPVWKSPDGRLVPHTEALRQIGRGCEA